MRLASFALVALLLLVSFGFAQDDEVLILKPDETEQSAPSGQTPVESSRTLSKPESSNKAYSAFYETWRQFELQLKVGVVDQNLIAELIQQRNKNGISKITEFALSAVRFGEDRLEERKPDDALHLFRAAASLDPALSLAYYSQARALMASSWTNAPSAIQAAIAGMFAPASTLNGKIYLLSKYAFIVIATLLVLGCAFAIIMLAKYQRLLRHDTMEKYTSFTTTTVNLVVWIVLFLPVFLLAGFLWLVPFWLMLFWKYARNSERILSVLFFLVFTLAYPVYHYVVKLSGASVDPSIAPFIRVFSDGPSPRLLADFRDYSVDHPVDSDATIMLAHLYRADGKYMEAIRVLQKHILDHPDDARAYNNLGHIYFLEGETDIGLRMVQKAQGLDARNPIYPYNLSGLLRAKFNFSNAEESLQRARQLDAGYIRKLEENPYASLEDAVPTEKVIFSRIQEKIGKFENYLINPFSVFSLLLLGIAVFGSLLSRKKDHAKECIKCGRPFCRKCQPAVKELRFCTQCLHIFVKKDGVSPASRKDKMREIEDYSKRQNLFLQVSSLVLPGFGNLYKNRIWFGIILLFFWFLFLVLIFYNWKYARLSFYESTGTVVLIPVFLLFLALLYVVANISLFRRAKA